MKRLTTLAVALVMAVCFAVTAQANVLDDYASYKGTYTGQEAVLDAAGNLITDPQQLLTSGLQMYALAVIDIINTTQGAGSSAPVDYPPIFTARLDTGTYFATLTGLVADEFVYVGEDSMGYQVYDLYFTGGTLSWYYSDNTALNNILQYMTYDSVIGDYVYNGTVLGDILPDPFLVADLASADPEHSGKVTVTVDPQGGLVETNFTFYANVSEGYELWQSGEYGNNNGSVGYDMEFGGKLRWEDGRFYINDGSFRVSAPTPEPSSIILMSLGLLLTAAFVRRQQSK